MNASFLSMETYAQVLQNFAAFAAAAQAKTSVKGVLSAFVHNVPHSPLAVTVVDTVPSRYEDQVGKLLLFVSPTGVLPRKRVKRRVVWKSPRGLQPLRNAHEGIFSSYRRRADGAYSYRVYRTSLEPATKRELRDAPSAWLMHVVACPGATPTSKLRLQASEPAPAPAPVSAPLTRRKTRVAKPLVIPRKFAPLRSVQPAPAPPPAAAVMHTQFALPLSVHKSSTPLVPLGVDISSLGLGSLAPLERMPSLLATPLPVAVPASSRVVPSPTAARILDYASNTGDSLLLSPSYASIVSWQPKDGKAGSLAFPPLGRQTLASLNTTATDDAAWWVEMSAAVTNTPAAAAMPLPSPIASQNGIWG